MAKKITTSAGKTVAAPAKTVSTPVRNSAIPKVVPAKKSPAITSDLIAVRAYEIHLSGTGGSESDNWFRAERELRSEI